MEARRREQPPVLHPSQFPNADIRVTEAFLREREELLLYTAASLLDAALATPGAVDLDVREALQALIKTYRTLESGLIYETRPENPVAGAIQARLQQSFQELRQAMAQRTTLTAVRDLDILGILVFLERMELQNNNGRRRGRAFLDFLRSHFPVAPQAATTAGARPLIKQG